MPDRKKKKEEKQLPDKLRELETRYQIYKIKKGSRDSFPYIFFIIMARDRLYLHLASKSGHTVKTLTRARVCVCICILRTRE